MKSHFEIRDLAGLRVFGEPILNGGGAGYGQDYLEFVAANIGKVNRLFEWCAGPGYIGFGMLGAGLCETLCLADINPRAVEACRYTIAENGLEDRATVYRSEGLSEIPTDERWDLVVGNPPHSGTDRPIPGIVRPSLIYQDPSWNIHRAFYERVVDFLAPGGQVLIQENLRFSCVETFREMIERNGLEIVDAAACAHTAKRHYYYIWARRVAG